MVTLVQTTVGSCLSDIKEGLILTQQATLILKKLLATQTDSGLKIIWRNWREI